MRVLLLLTIILLSSCMSTLVKRQKTPGVVNNAPVVVPFTAQKIQPVQMTPTTPAHQPIPVIVSKESMNAVNSIAIILGTIVLSVCFLPFILGFLDYVLEVCTGRCKAFAEWTRNRKKK
jgi:hypothetical protein